LHDLASVVTTSHPAIGDEPSLQEPPSRFEARLNQRLGRVANILTVVAVLLIGFVLVALVSVVVNGIEPLLAKPRNFAEAATQGVDAAFLAIILLEVTHTTLSRGPMTRQLQEFLVIGITVGVRSGLEVAAAAQKHSSREVAIDLGINAMAVLVLVLALCLLRWRLHSEHERPGHGSGQPGYTPHT
jgi:hypothetical protein